MTITRRQEPRTTLSITRAWRKGDRVDIEMPMALAAEPFADEPAVQAFLYGPMVLAGDLGNVGLTDALVNNQQGPAVVKVPMSVPELRASGK
jgi:DUF1680 family protein